MEGWIDIGDMIRNLEEIYQQAPDGWNRDFSDYTDALRNLQKVVNAFNENSSQRVTDYLIGDAIKSYKHE